MGRYRAVLPAAMGLGASLAVHHGLEFSVALGVALCLLCWALRCPVGTGLGLAAVCAVTCVAFGRSASTWDSPCVSTAGVRPSPRVELVGECATPWRPFYEGWRARVRVAALRCGRNPFRPSSGELAVEVGSSHAEPLPCSLRALGTPRRTAGLHNDPEVPPGPWRLGVKSPKLVQGRGGAEVGTRTPALRQWVDRRLERIQETGPRGLARALTVGDRHELSPALLEGLRRLGLLHLLALSGLHVGLVFGAARLSLPFLPVRVWFPLAALLVLGQLWVAGFRPSLVRATVMILLWWGTKLVHRRPASPNLLALYVLSTAVVAPGEVQELGFQLSVAATAGILCAIYWKPWFLSRKTRSVRPMPRTGWQTALAVSLGAQLGAGPLVAAHFRSWSPWSPVWNLLGIPWVLVAWLGSWLGVVASERLLAVPVALLTWSTDAISMLDALTPFFKTQTTTPAAVAAWLLGTAVLMVWGFRIRGLLAVAVAALLLFATSWGWRWARPSAKARHAPLELVVLDVGQGDALLLRDGPRALLVDGGGRRRHLASRAVWPALRRLGIRRLGAIALSHPDQDHCEGLLAVARWQRPRELWVSPGWQESSCARALLGVPGLHVRSLWAGHGHRVGRWEIEVLHPPPGLRGGTNERSMVLLARGGGRSFLLTGDITEMEERSLLEGLLAELRIDYLKLAHHGSGSSTHGRWLARLRPRLALISAGAGNRYGHPSESVLQRLERAGVRWLRTDRDGWIRLTQRGKAWVVSTPNAPGAAGRS